MSDTIQSAEALAKSFYESSKININKRYRPESGIIKSISEVIKADRAAHIEKGREMERKRLEACVKALENALVAVKPDATRLYRESMQREISKALADQEATK